MAVSWVKTSLMVATCTGLFATTTAHAETLILSCKAIKGGSYQLLYDTETRAFSRRDDKISQTYRVVRVQADRGDLLVWAVTRESGGDVLAFFGSKTMAKYFYGNGSETTDTCTQSSR